MRRNQLLPENINVVAIASHCGKLEFPHPRQQRLDKQFADSASKRTGEYSDAIRGLLRLFKRIDLPDLTGGGIRSVYPVKYQKKTFYRIRTALEIDKTEFTAVITDFRRICRGEITRHITEIRNGLVRPPGTGQHFPEIKTRLKQHLFHRQRLILNITLAAIIDRRVIKFFIRIVDQKHTVRDRTLVESVVVRRTVKSILP